MEPEVAPISSAGSSHNRPSSAEDNEEALLLAYPVIGGPSGKLPSKQASALRRLTAGGSSLASHSSPADSQFIESWDLRAPSSQSTDASADTIRSSKHVHKTEIVAVPQGWFCLPSQPVPLPFSPVHHARRASQSWPRSPLCRLRGCGKSLHPQ
jgi:hypothetical protein